VWHLKPAASDPDTVLAGVEDAALFRSVDGGQSWSELSGLREHGSGPRWQPGAGGMCLHSILPDPRDTDLMLVAISAAGVFRTDDGGKSWRASNRGLVSEGIPDPDAEVGHSVHKLARHPARPDPVYMQKHWDVMRSDDGGEHWVDIGGNLPTTSASWSTCTPTNPRLCMCCHHQRHRALPTGGQAAGVPQLQRWNEWEPLTNGLPQQNCYVTCCAMRWPSTDSTSAASTSEPPAGRSTHPQTEGTAGLPSCVTCPRCCRWRCRGCHEPGTSQAPHSSAPPRQRRQRGDAGRRGPSHTGRRPGGPPSGAARHVRDHETRQRRAFVRFFACEQDLSHQPPDAPLPELTARGEEPLLIVGAMAGG
jgi:hypothetical protein